MDARLCVFCVHFKFNPAIVGHGTTETGPYMVTSGGGGCEKGHLGSRNNVINSEDDLRRIILTAVDCDDYELPADIQAQIKEKLQCGS